ncbi:SusD/RagB family nutrient-binding outer membrane lipoprotein [Danxiaibacter flavus]|uniref:SusD/RagB family nutrient-binding outer membrane lipoprotein n=1 Tax=Danxiaibacter flavus TaxID=3049108 RepID=A0ABV3ZCT7_9BACT|nr:SusD/RagB family nutrient-binding outer membrane lipoprotein [Chitinophagaceae bacterium DXS]
MKSNNIIYLSLITVFILVGSCKKGDDLFIDPSHPLTVTPQTLLTSVEVNTFMNIEGDLARVSSVLDQQMAGATGQYQDLQNYKMTESDYDNHWAGLWSNTMKNAKTMMDTYSGESPWYGGIARIMMAMNLGVATDIWGDVPYSEAFLAPANFAAKYQPQQEILDTIQNLLSEAITALSKPDSENHDLPGSDDLIFGGDAASWIQAAWTLKARYANRLSLKDPTGSATNVLNYLAKGISDPAHNLEAKHDGSGTAQNQWGAFQNQREGYFVGNKFFIDMLNANSDPRLTYYFAEGTDGTYFGADITEEVINTDASPIGPYFDVDQNYPLVTSYEARFLEAEAKQRLGQDASVALNSGIKESVQYVTKGTNDGSSIAKYTQATATKTAILTEKYKAMFGQIEGWNDVRRTNIPALTPRPASAGAVLSYIPVRLPTPSKERLGNPDNAKVIELNVPVWWATP